MAWLSVFIAFVTVLAVCRMTRLVTEDTITQPIRLWIARRAIGSPAARAPGRAPARAWTWLAKLVTCPWCSGFWISAAVTLAYFRCWLGAWPHTLPGLYTYTAAAFACSWLSAIIADWLDAPPPPRVITLSSGHLDITTRQGPPA